MRVPEIKAWCQSCLCLSGFLGGIMMAANYWAQADLRGGGGGNVTISSNKAKNATGYQPGTLALN